MIEVTGILKIKHAALRRAVKEVGSQSALARLLGVHVSTMGRWCNLQECPLKEPRGSWTEQRLTKLHDHLLLLTGQSMEELFPQELRDQCNRNTSPLKFERDMKVRTLALADYRDRETARLTLEDPAEICDTMGLVDALDAALDTLSDREGEIIKLRYGLGGGASHTLEEVAHIFKLTKERVRQIEAKAVRKLQQPSLSRNLIEYTDIQEEDDDGSV